jgi:hypothetical protein
MEKDTLTEVEYMLAAKRLRGYSATNLRGETNQDIEDFRKVSFPEAVQKLKRDSSVEFVRFILEKL